MSLPGRFLTIAGQRVFYHRAGKGRPLVLVHGLLVSHWTWRHVIGELSARNDVIAIDLPGFGESDRPSPFDFRYDETGYLEVVVGVLDELGLERASLAGHALGGAVALAAAARRPERVDRLVLVAPLVYPFRMPAGLRALRVPVVGPMLLRGAVTRAVLGRQLEHLWVRDPSLITEEWVDYLWERLHRPGGHEAVHAALRLHADPAPIPRLLRAVRAPALVVWGADDRLFPSSNAARLCGELPGAELAMVPRCGHLVPEERPRELLDAVLPFLGPAERPRAAAGAGAT
jgi:pimeloyl-ACP methyl ester carboxylesterase